MLLYKCDRCGNMQEPGKKFYNLHELGIVGDRGTYMDTDLCKMCVLQMVKTKDTSIDEAELQRDLDKILD